MEHKPHDPGKHPGKLHPADGDDAVESPHCGHVPFIDVTKWPQLFFSGHLPGNDEGNLGSLLDCHLGHTRQRLAVLDKMRRVSNDENGGVAGDTHIAGDLDAPYPVRFNSQPHSVRRGCHTRCPNDRLYRLFCVSEVANEPISLPTPPASNQQSSSTSASSSGQRSRSSSQIR